MGSPWSDINMDIVRTDTLRLLRTILSVMLLSPPCSCYGTGPVARGVLGRGHSLSSLSGSVSPLPSSQPGHVSSLPRSEYSLPRSEYSLARSEYSLPPCSHHYHAQFPVCSHSRSYQNCTVILDNMYTIQYKEECGRRYDKICYGPGNTDCKAVVDPGCYSVPTHSPVQVAREICYNPRTGERCDKYPGQYNNNNNIGCN